MKAWTIRWKLILLLRVKLLPIVFSTLIRLNESNYATLTSYETHPFFQKMRVISPSGIFVPRDLAGSAMTFNEVQLPDISATEASSPWPTVSCRTDVLRINGSSNLSSGLYTSVYGVSNRKDDQMLEFTHIVVRIVVLSISEYYIICLTSFQT